MPLRTELLPLPVLMLCTARPEWPIFGSGRWRKQMPAADSPSWAALFLDASPGLWTDPWPGEGESLTSAVIFLHLTGTTTGTAVSWLWQSFCHPGTSPGDGCLPPLCGQAHPHPKFHGDPLNQDPGTLLMTGIAHVMCCMDGALVPRRQLGRTKPTSSVAPGHLSMLGSVLSHLWPGRQRTWRNRAGPRLERAQRTRVSHRAWRGSQGGPSWVPRSGSP